MKTFIATKPGFFEKLRIVGEKFEVPDDTPLGSWVKVVGSHDDLEPDPRGRTWRDPAPVDSEATGNHQDTVDVHESRKAPSGKAPQAGKK